MTKDRIINGCLLISFLCCYLEWGHDGSEFIFQVEYDLLLNAGNSLSAFAHPFIFIPFVGQLLLLYNTFRKKPNRKLTITSILLLGVLVLMILVVGIFSTNLKIFLSTLPFISLSIFFIINKKAKPNRI